MISRAVLGIQNAQRNLYCTIEFLEIGETAKIVSYFFTFTKTRGWFFKCSYWPEKYAFHRVGAGN